MEPCGILDSPEEKMLEQLVDKKVSEMERSGFIIITSADRHAIEKELRNELFLRTGKIIN